MINQFGWSQALSQQFAPFAEQGLVPARVVVQHRGQYDLITPEGEAKAVVSGRFAHEAGEGGFPVTGDWVAASVDNGLATIQAVLPRRTAFVRKAAGPGQIPQIVAANVDVAILAAALTPDFNARRLERYLAIAWQSGARPLVVLTKADLCADVDEAVASAQAVAAGVDILAISSATGDGLADLAARLLPGETAVLVGSSGAGKSTLVNALAGEDRMAVGAIREGDGRGRHTTSHRELVLLPSGALILDTPGMREIALLDVDEGLSTTFEDIDALAEQCRFHDCGHTNEPGCAIVAALETGVLDPDRWRNYQKLQKEAAFSDRKEDRAARAAQRRKWVTVAKAQRASRKKGEW